MRGAYGSGVGENGSPGKIGGNPGHESSTQATVDKAVSEIKAGRPVILWTERSLSGTHFLCVCGWTANAGSKPTWDQLVCIDPARNGSGEDGLTTMDRYPDSSHYICTFENWTPGDGQTKRSN